jgi:hypothetical protein
MGLLHAHNEDRLPHNDKMHCREKGAHLNYHSKNSKEERLVGSLYPTITIFCLVVVLALLPKQQEFNIVKTFQPLIACPWDCREKFHKVTL